MDNTVGVHACFFYFVNPRDIHEYFPNPFSTESKSVLGSRLSSGRGVKPRSRNVITARRLIQFNVQPLSEGLKVNQLILLADATRTRHRMSIFHIGAYY